MTGLDAEHGVVHGVFVRHIPGGADPLYQAPDPADGRWQHGRVVAACYFADEPATAWAEWYRALAEFRTAPEIAGCTPQPPPIPITDVPPVPLGMRT